MELQQKTQDRQLEEKELELQSQEKEKDRLFAAKHRKQDFMLACLQAGKTNAELKELWALLDY